MRTDNRLSRVEIRLMKVNALKEITKNKYQISKTTLKLEFGTCDLYFLVHG
jgi:hypothetical protein